jgi:glycerol-3-phosphate acyltransferase PlsY
MLSLVFLLLFAYLCGSIPTGKLIAHRRDVDIQKRGSGNIGFANVRRILGWKDGLLTLAGDIAKGFLPAFLGLYFFTPTVAFFAGLMAMLGHIFCVWLRFHGGKGIATGLGVVAVLSPVAAIIGTAVYIMFCLYKTQSSTASIAGALATASIAILVQLSTWWQYLLLLLLIAWTLRQNLWGTVPDYDA